MTYKNTNDPTYLPAIATWKQKKERDVAMKQLHKAKPHLKDSIIEHRKHGITTVIENFEEIATIKLKRKK